ncbi:hypothetical protein ANN_22820 [Periplaneta americana]|uniref:Uncharacterized protein n=1 Tax=Periplaneta americana TaxID=6978 RepID=A0ABQ8SJR5_PERAM|nr:hypothetical protein ANN_22820 [Periplaneta americana]
MAVICEGGNEPPGSLKVIRRMPSFASIGTTPGNKRGPLQSRLHYTQRCQGGPDKRGGEWRNLQPDSNPRKRMCSFMSLTLYWIKL